MNMFCYQCQETGNGKGCTTLGICGKNDEVANLQDLLIYMLQGISFYASELFAEGAKSDTQLLRKTGELVTECFFTTVTNTDFDPERIIAYAQKIIDLREVLRGQYLKSHSSANIPDNALWLPKKKDEFYTKSLNVGVLEVRDADIRSVKETITYGCKGISAYTYHASSLGFYDESIYRFLFKALKKVDADTPMDELVEIVFETGKYNVAAMALLDKAHTTTYGNPEPTKVNTGALKNSGILVTGHDLKDLDILLKQTQGTGVDVYTNGEMILAQSLPHFKKYKNFAGHYGNAWWQQTTEFNHFNGPIIVTSNCIVPVEEGYKDRIFTTSVAGYPGVTHIDEVNGKKDFSAVINLAKKLKAPDELNEPSFMTGFGHSFLSSVKDKVLGLVKAGKIKKFVLMGGCDGRDLNRQGFTDRALALPKDAIILTAGCAKYRYIKKISDTIDGIPRVLDAGQCNDNYSFVVFAMEVAEALGTKDLNELPLEFDLAWYDQKAVAVLLSLIYLGFKNIKIGPTLPEFLTQYLIKKLEAKVNISSIA